MSPATDWRRPAPIPRPAHRAEALLPSLPTISAVERPHPIFWIGIFAGMGAFATVAFSDGARAWFGDHLFQLPSGAILKAGFAVACACHVLEASVAYRKAKAHPQHGPPLGWLAQTLALGYPSLRLVLARIARSEVA